MDRSNLGYRIQNFIWAFLLFSSFVHIGFGLHLFGDGSQMFGMALDKSVSFIATRDFRPIGHIVNELPVWLLILIGIKNFKILSWAYGLTLYLAPITVLYYFYHKFEKYQSFIISLTFLLMFLCPLNKVSELNIALAFWVGSFILLREKADSYWCFFLMTLAVWSHQAVFIGYGFLYLMGIIKKNISKKTHVFYLVTIATGILTSMFVKGTSARGIFFQSFVLGLTQLNMLLYFTLPLVAFIVGYFLFLKKSEKDWALALFLIAGVGWQFFIFDANPSDLSFFIRPFVSLIIPFIAILLIDKVKLADISIYGMLILLSLQLGMILNKHLTLLKLLDTSPQSVMTQHYLFDRPNMTIMQCPLFEHTIFYYQAHYFNKIKVSFIEKCPESWAKISCRDYDLLNRYGMTDVKCELK